MCVTKHMNIVELTTFRYSVKHLEVIHKLHAFEGPFNLDDSFGVSTLYTTRLKQSYQTKLFILD